MIKWCIMYHQKENLTILQLLDFILNMCIKLKYKLNKVLILYFLYFWRLSHLWRAIILLFWMSCFKFWSFRQTLVKSRYYWELGHVHGEPVCVVHLWHQAAVGHRNIVPNTAVPCCCRQHFLQSDKTVGNPMFRPSHPFGLFVTQFLHNC